MILVGQTKDYQLETVRNWEQVPAPDASKHCLLCLVVTFPPNWNHYSQSWGQRRPPSPSWAKQRSPQLADFPLLFNLHYTRSLLSRKKYLTKTWLPPCPSKKKKKKTIERYSLGGIPREIASPDHSPPRTERPDSILGNSTFNTSRRPRSTRHLKTISNR